MTAASVLLREQLATLIGVDDVPWAAAAIPPTGVLWMILSLQRGALQGLRAYRPVGVSIVVEAAGRLVCGLLFVAVGLGVTGALLGTPFAFILVALWLERELRRVVGPVGRRRGAAAHPALAGGRRVGADHRALPAGLAAERRRHRGQAHALRRRGRLLRGRGGGRQGRRVGRDRHRAAPAARGHAPGRCRPGPAAGAPARAGHLRARSPPRPWSSSRRSPPSCCASPSARSSPTPPTRCCCWARR